jgi:hypothetical protein
MAKQTTQEPKERVRRRGAGEGSISQRADGTWAAVLQVGIDESGKRRAPLALRAHTHPSLIA